MKQNKVQRIRFTLVELLVVIAVIALLMSLLLPALRSAKTKAWQIACASQLKQTGSAAMMYATDNNDWMPLAADDTYVGDMPYFRTTWIAFIHEYVDGKRHTAKYISKVFQCPAGTEELYTAYGNGGNYQYGCRLGWTYAYNAYGAAYGAPRKLGKCTMPASCGMIIDGKNKTKNRCLFDFCLRSGLISYLDSRHGIGGNALYADMHVSLLNPFNQTDNDAALFGAYMNTSWVDGYYWPPL